MSAGTVAPAPPSAPAAPVVAPVLSCTGLRHRFGSTTAVDGVEFSIAPGEAYGLLGPNGAGKTTTIAMLVGLLDPDEGEVRIAGRAVADDPRGARARIGYVPQEIALYPELTARENLRFFGRLYGLRGRALTARTGEVLELVGLADRAGDRVGTYSGGMQRRVNIAAGLLHEPALLVLDEPTVGVDPQSRNSILDGLEQLVADGTSLLYTSHYMEEVERICDRVGIIDRGRIIAEGTRRELVAGIGRSDRIELVVAGDAASAADALRRVPGVETAGATGAQVEVLAAGGRHLLPALIAAVPAGATVTSVEVVEPDLEAVFLHLTGASLRD